MTSVEVQGREVRLPVVVRDASVLSATFTVDADVVQQLLPAGLAPAVVRPGRAVAVVAGVDYRDNPLGDYDEVGIIFPVRRPGAAPRLPVIGGLLDQLRGDTGVHIAHLPVDQEFTWHAGRRIWGYPKTLDEVEIRRHGARAGARWRRDGRTILTLTVPRGGRLRVPETATATYSVLDGQLVRTTFSAGGAGFRAGVGGARLQLGDHPVAADLRRLAFSRVALGTMWIEHATATFAAPEPV